MVALNAKMSLDGFSKELRFVGVGLGNFVSMLQSRIIVLTLWLKEVFDSFESVSKLKLHRDFDQRIGIG